MKVSIRRLKKAAARKVRAREGPSEEQQAPAPKRLRLQVSPSGPQGPPSPPVDLTADTPPEGTVMAEVSMEQTPAELLVAETGGGPRDEAPVTVVPSSGRAPADDPPGEEPRREEIAGGSGARPARRRPSLMDDGRRAEQLLSRVVQPEFQEELRGKGANRFYRESFSAVVRIVNSLVLTREALLDGESAYIQIQDEVKDAEARAAAAERALESERADRALETKGAVSRAEVDADRLRAALNQLAEAEGALEARNTRLAELESLVRSTEDNVRRAEDKVREAEDRARHAEDRARHAEDKARHAEGDAELARVAERAAISSLAEERKARSAEVEEVAVARAAKAVEDFRGSERFEDEVAEAAAEAYLQGFRRGREKVARDLGIPQALSVEPDRLSEVSSSDDEPEAANP